MRANTFSLQILNVFKCPVFKALNNSIFMFTLGQNIFALKISLVFPVGHANSQKISQMIKSFK